MSTSSWRLVVAVLWVAVLGSSLGVIYAKHEARSKFNELQTLKTSTNHACGSDEKRQPVAASTWHVSCNRTH